LAVDSSYIATISDFTVGTTGDITEAQLSTMNTIAEKELSRDVSVTGIDSETKDYLTALLICDMIAAKTGKGIYQSERMGDYQYSKSSEGSIYKQRYYDAIKKFGGTAANYGVKRADAETLGKLDDFKLDQNKRKAIIENDTNLVETL
jgi:hypothetical protein